MKKILISLIGFALVLSGCSGSKAPKADDVMKFLETVYSSEALEDQDFTGYKFKNKFTEEAAYESTADYNAGNDQEFIELKKSFFGKVFDSVEYHVGEITKEDTTYTAKVYLSLMDFTYYNSDNIVDILDFYDKIIQIVYPELTPMERFDITTEIGNNKRTELVMKTGETLNLSDYTSFISMVVITNTVLDETGPLVMTTTEDPSRNSTFVPTYFEVEFQFTYENGKVVPVSFNGEDATNVKEMTDVIFNTSLHFATEAQAKKEREEHSENYTSGSFDTSVFKETQEK